MLAHAAGTDEFEGSSMSLKLTGIGVRRPKYIRVEGGAKTAGMI